MKELLDRLSVLKNSGTIHQEVYQKMTALLYILDSKNLIQSNDKTTKMITHIAMVLDRLMNGESLKEIDEDLKMVVIEHPLYTKADELWQECEYIFTSIPEGEKYYILANFCNILGE